MPKKKYYKYVRWYKLPDTEANGQFWRKCSKCSCDKVLEDFTSSKKGLRGKSRICKKCMNLKNRKLESQDPNWSAKQKLANEKFRDKKSGTDYFKKYYSTEKRKIRELQNPSLKLARLARMRVLECVKQLKNEGFVKYDSTLEMTGCSWGYLKTYLESLFQPGMTWENHGAYKRGGSMTWHIDHIRPCASFDLMDPEQQKQCFHYTNLQPLWAVDNLNKADKIICQDHT